jgi:deoxycytidylate deaminase
MRPLLLIAAILPAFGSLAEDVRSSDGTVYHNIKEVKAEPDGLVFVYDKGMAKVDFERLPPEMQRRFGYDRKRATAYRAQQAAAVQENQQIVKVHEDQQLERIRKMMESGGSADELMYSGRSVSANEVRYARQVQRQMEAREDAVIAAGREPRNFWTAPFWQSPVVQILGSILRSSPDQSGFDNHRGFLSP